MIIIIHKSLFKTAYYKTNVHVDWTWEDRIKRFLLTMYSARCIATDSITICRGLGDVPKFTVKPLFLLVIFFFILTLIFNINNRVLYTLYIYIYLIQFIINGNN